MWRRRLPIEIVHGAGSDVRANAARAAGILRDAAAVPALIEGLHSKDSQMIFECLIALAEDSRPQPGRRCRSWRTIWMIVFR